MYRVLRGGIPISPMEAWLQRSALFHRKESMEPQCLRAAERHSHGPACNHSGGLTPLITLGPACQSL